MAPRRLKRRISLSDDEEESQDIKASQSPGGQEDPGEAESGQNTFINNSDYLAESNNGTLNRSHNETNDSDMESVGVGKEQTPDISKANETLDTSDEITKEASSSMIKSNGGDTKPELNEIPILQPAMELKPPSTSSHPASAGSELETGKLNFSQQQDSIGIASPKRRESFQVNMKKSEPRLVIDKLVLTNFKSYAGRQEIGPFNASFSAVIGPNGSGKSNVIDSLLFVFGFRASKMRQGKLSELIHNSAGNRLDFCQVDIHFNHVIDDPEVDGKADIVSDGPLIVSRKATKNNQSIYYVNGKTSNYTEVTQLLREKGIDLDHKRFLILQGEVESIAQMKPKAEKEGDDGLLEYLEDIIGTSHYKELIEENLSKIDALNDVCVEKSNRFELVEKDKNLLEEKKIEALKFLEMEKKLMNAKSIQFQINILETSKQLAEKQEQYNRLNQEHEQETEKNKELNDQLTQEINEQKTIKSEIQSLNKEINKHGDKVKALNKAIVSVDEKLKNLNSKLKKSQKTKEQLEHTLLMAQNKLNSHNEVTSQYQEELDGYTNDLQTEKEKLDEIRLKMTSKTSQYTEEIDSLHTKLEPWNDKLKEKDNQIRLIESEIEMLNNQRENKGKALENARQRLIDIKTEGKQKEMEFQENHDKLEHITEQIELGEEQCSNERKQLQSRKNDLDSMRSRVHDSLSKHQHNENKNRVLSGLSRLAKSGRISGFYGRLGDLGVIDDKYDIAISTASPGLDSMVVDSVETAQTCIQYLRKNNLGFANFICLEKLRKFNMSPINTPGNPASVKRLFDLIKPKHEKFLPAFYSKLYDTLVATDLQEARQVAYGPKRFRVVTLDGKLVDTSGTMSGGGNSFAKGAMILASSSKLQDQMDISDEDIDQLKADLKQAENKYDTDYQEFQTKESQLRSLKELKPELEFNMSKLKLEIEALGSEKKEVSQLCKKLIAESENNDASSKIEQDIEAKQQEKDAVIKSKEELKSQTLDLQNRVNELEEKIMEAGGVELRLQSSKVDLIKQKIEIINDKVSHDRMSKRKVENEIKRVQKVITESAIEIEKTEKELQLIKDHDTDKQEELDSLNKLISELEQKKDAKEQALESVVNSLEEKQEQINQFKSYEIDLENKMEKLGSFIKKFTHDIEADEENLQALIVRDTSEYISWIESEEEQAKYNGTEIEKLTEDDIDKIDIEQINGEIDELEKYMNNVNVDIEILKEYGNKIQEFKVRQDELNESIESRDQIKNYCEELKRNRLDEFMEGFNTISLSLKEMYQMITMGGNAELELVDSLDPFAEGILFSVMPPKKSWKNIGNLSGGEKTLSSLALVFALHKYKPTPLYVMDEIDAALDFRNVSIVANYIKERTKNGQFIVISLRNNMFELANQLVGIYKVSNMTRSVSLQNRELL